MQSNPQYNQYMQQQQNPHFTRQTEENDPNISPGGVDEDG